MKNFLRFIFFVFIFGLSAFVEGNDKSNFNDRLHEVESILDVKYNHLKTVLTQLEVNSGLEYNNFVYRSYSQIKKGIYNNVIKDGRYRLIFSGLKETITITVLSVIVGTIMGAIICYMRMSKKRLFSFSAKYFIIIMRGIPVLVLLMLMFYVVFASVNIDPVFVAVIAFGLNFAAYVSEMFRAGIESIDGGQSEAGIALGFSKIETFIYIVLPQAIKRIIQLYKGELISLLKMTSIVGYIAIQDLTKSSDIIRSRTFDAFFPLLMVAFIYLSLSWIFTVALDYLELSITPKRIKNR